MDERMALGAQWNTARPVPSPAQLAWQRDELAMFLHFGVNTFTDREWGDGKEAPAIFDPSRLDARQWARTAKEAGFRAIQSTPIMGDEVVAGVISTLYPHVHRLSVHEARNLDEIALAASELVERVR